MILYSFFMRHEIREWNYLIWMNSLKNATQSRTRKWLDLHGEWTWWSSGETGKCWVYGELSCSCQENDRNYYLTPKLFNTEYYLIENLLFDAIKIIDLSTWSRWKSDSIQKNMMTLWKDKLFNRVALMYLDF